MTWRIYLIGAGAIAIEHAKAAAKLGDVLLYAADPSDAARANFAAHFPQASLFHDAASMLAESPARERDIVVVAAPPWLHRDASLQAFASGRHVLCEKPVARTRAELADMLAAAKKADRRLVDCSVRFLIGEPLSRARQLLQEGAIGTPYHVRLVNRRPRSRPGIEYQPASSWFLDKTKSGGGVVFDWSVYDLTMLFDVLRPVHAHIHNAWVATPRTAVDPVGHLMDVETHAGASMTLELADGSRVPLDYERGNGLHGEPQSLLSIDGTDGGLSWQWCPPFEDNTPTLTHLFDVEGKLEKRVETFTGFGGEGIHSFPLLALAAELEGKQDAVLTTAQLAFNFGVLAAIYENAESGRAVEVRLGR